MTIFKSRQVNLDPWPFVNPADGSRWYAEGGVCWPETGTEAGLVHEWSSTLVYDPRPEFEPTRDPEPWVDPLNRNRWGLGYKERFVWAPRRKQFDTPVNRVLAQFRNNLPYYGESLAESAEWWVSDLAHCTEGFTPDEIEHARKVLTRLAGAA